MKWPATERYALEPAPGTLGLVSDLLNTLAAGRPLGPDLLASGISATEWANQALKVWAEARSVETPEVALTDNDAENLRELRAEIHRSSAGLGESTDVRTGRAIAVHLATELAPGRGVAVNATGSGWRRVASAVMLELFVAETLGTRRRLKVCRNPRCTVAFYDHSRNCSGVWHSATTCGNVENLRASRARRRSRGTAS